MDQVIEFFSGLFAADKWPARWHCGYWSDFHGWLYILSDMMIWFAYFLIPVIILQYVARKKAGIKFQKVYLLFASFILLCGTTHFLDALMFWHPIYRFNGLVRLATGIVSLFTVFHLIQILPKAFRQKTNAELEREIALREEAERKLGEANKNLEAFAFVASHDLQEPLRKIGIFSNMLNKGNNQLDNGGKEIVDKIISSTNRLRTMIDDVLTLSTIPDTIPMTKVNLAAPAQKAIEDLEFKIREKNAVIHIGNLPEAMGNQAYLSHLFMNLIGNAIKFCKQTPVINITGEQTDGKAIIEIADNGIGMNDGDLEKIFTAFHRLHSKAIYEGSGIGLAISKRIVDLHCGKISVTSEIDKGTTFTIALRAAAMQQLNPV